MAYFVMKNLQFRTYTKPKGTKMQEIWKFIPNTNKQYQVSNLGRVRKNGKILKLTANSRGYLGVGIFGTVKNVHRLVITTFKAVPDSKGLVVNHIDGNKLNNKLTNLEWCTQKYNIFHSKTLGKHYVFTNEDRKKAETNRLNAVRKKVLCLETKEVFESMSAAAIAKNVHAQNIYKCCNKKLNTTGGFHWEYVA